MEKLASPEQSAVLDHQYQHQHLQSVWDQTHPEYSHDPSYAAQTAQRTFQNHGCKKILELGSGDGRDTLFFLKEGFQVHAVDYASSSLEQISEQAKTLGIETHFTSPSDIDALTHNDERIATETFEEGPLPKRLSLVSLRNNA